MIKESRSRAGSAAVDPVLLVIVLVGLALRIAPWLHANVFLGVQEYDDGVYYGAAKLLLHGQFPYRDFTIVHPPGSALLLLPFAALGAVLGDPIALASARVAVALVAVANTLLVYRLAQHLPVQPSRVRAVPLVAAAVYAVLPNAVLAEHTVLLEPLVNLFCLAATALLCRPTDSPTGRAAALAGLLCALALSIKLFAGTYVLVLLAWLLITRRSRVRSYLAGLVGAAALLVGPFVLAAPGRFWHAVVVTQLARPLDASVTGLPRLADMLGLGGLLVALPLVIALVCVSLARVSQDWRSPLTLWLAIGLSTAAAFSVSASYFPHYGAFLAPPLALVVAGAVACRPAGRVVRQLPVAAVVALLAVLVGSSVHEATRAQGQLDLRRAAWLVPAGSCVFAEDASTALAAGLFAVPSARCPGWVDGRGVAYAGNTDWPKERNFYFAGFTGDTAWQRTLRSQLEQADFLLLHTAPEHIAEWSEATQTYAGTQFRPVLVLPAKGRGSAQLWRRVRADAAAGQSAG